MLRRLLRFGASRVEDIMVPRADIIALEETTACGVAANFGEAGVSRIPLFSETLDDPRGMIHIKDLFRWLTRRRRASLQSADCGRRRRPVEAATSSPRTSRPRPRRPVAADLSRQDPPPCPLCSLRPCRRPTC